ncbi:MFS transporter [Streptomyces sp. NPDC055210]
MTASDSLPRNRDFQFLLVGQGLSMLGSGAAAITLPLLVLAITGSPLWVGLVEAVWTGAIAVACLAAGPIVDRYPRRTIMLWCEYGRLTTSAALALAITLDQVTIPVLLGAGVALGFLTAPFNTAGVASVQKIVPKHKLASALAVNQIRGQVAYLLGPVLGGFLFTVAPSLPYWLNTVSFLASAASIHALRSSLDASERSEAGWWRSFKAGVRFLWQDRVLRSLTLIASAQNFAIDGVALTVVVVSRRHGMSSLTIGILYDFWAAGALVGALLAPRLNDRVSRPSILLASGALCALAVPLMALSADATVLAPLLTLCSLAVSVSASVITLARVLRTPDHLQGRAHSAITLLLMATPPLGSAFAGLLLNSFPETVSYLGFGALLVVLTLVTLREGRALLPSSDANVR